MSNANLAVVKDAGTARRFWPMLGAVVMIGIIAGGMYGMWRAREARRADAASPAGGFVPVIDRKPAPAHGPAGMAWIPGGTFLMGCDDSRMEDARPMHPVTLDGFWMDETPVINEEFAKFVEATKYVTVAEKTPEAKDFPGAPPENLVAGSCCFTPPKERVGLGNHLAWWSYVKGASWRHPEGPGSEIKGREQHPVTQVAFEDAQAYAKWAGKRLPTEAEFEYAARGGLDRKQYSWGEELTPGGKWVANIWQGRFPDQNLADDGYAGSSPVRAFPPNGFGLYDVGGNVWQWCSDWYRADYYATVSAGGKATKNPQGPADSLDPLEPGVKKRVLRSGSFLCSAEYCVRYLVGSRGKGADDSGTSNIGFRCVKGESD